MIPLRIDDNEVMLSLDVVESLPTLTIVLNKSRVNDKYSRQGEPPIPSTKSETPALFHDRFLSNRHSESLVDPRVPVRLYWLDEHYIATDWSLADGNSEPFAKTTLTKCFLMELPLTTSIGCGIDWPASRASVLLNINHQFVKWLVRVKAACMNADQCLTIKQFGILIELLDDSFRYGQHSSGIGRLQKYLEAWSKLPDLSPDLYPPKIRLSVDMFRLPHW